MKLSLTIVQNTIHATLVDSKTSKDFVSLLPLTFTMTDLFEREKIARLPRALAEGGHLSHTYEVGELAYWPPGPDIAIFYRHDGKTIAKPITVLAKLDGELNAFSTPGPVEVTIRVVT